jgi:hypothetical protein
MLTSEITPVSNPYAGSNWCAGFDWSVRVPNDLSGLEMYQTMDGDQPCYKNAWYIEKLFDVVGLKFKSVADYPKDNNTLRYMFKTESDADLAAAIVKGLDVDRMQIGAI